VAIRRILRIAHMAGSTVVLNGKLLFRQMTQCLLSVLASISVIIDRILVLLFVWLFLRN
jgi:hypothetical protein